MKENPPCTLCTFWRHALAWWFLCSPVLWMWPSLRTLTDTLVSALLLAPLFLWRPALRLGAWALVLVGSVYLGYFFAVHSAPDEYFWFTLRNSSAGEALEYASSYRWQDGARLLAWLLPASACAFWLSRQRHARARPWPRLPRLLLWLLALLWPLWTGISAAKGDSVEASLRKVNRLYPLALFETLARQQTASAHIFDVPEVAAPPAAARADLVVVVLGESASAQRWSLLGYDAADTNAALAPWRAQLHTLRVLANGNNTAQTVPMLLSGQTLERAATQGWSTYLDWARAAGFRVVTLSNQSTSGSEETLFHSAYRLRSHHYQHLPAGQWDGALTAPLQQALAASPPQQRLLVTLHTYGSHPRVAKRYPPEHARFADPYDNSIAYSSHLLAAWIAELQQQAQGRRALLLYIADHGLNLSDCASPYTHGSARSAFEVPLLLWHNDAFAAANPAWLQALAQHASAPRDGLPHYDNRVFSATLRDLLGYATPAYPAWAATSAPPEPQLDGQPYRERAARNACQVRE